MQEQLKAYKALYETAKQHRELIEDNHFRSIEEKVQELELSVEFNMKLQSAGYYWYEKHIGYGQCAEKDTTYHSPANLYIVTKKEV